MPEVAVLSPTLPGPPLVGGTAHLVGTIRQLARAYRVRLYALADEPARTWEPLLDVCESVATFPQGGRMRWRLGPPAVHAAASPRLRAHLRAEWARQPPDIVQLEFTTMAQYAPLARAAGALVVCAAHNAAFLAQRRRAARERSLKLRARRSLAALSLWLYELRALSQCDLVVTPGKADAAALQRWLRRVRVAHVPAAVDLDARPVCFNPDATDEVLFVGSYQHPPNVEGALWLAREVWPLVRAVATGARLTLAGRGPPPEIQELAAPDIHVPGTLDDLLPHYGRASVMVAPIFWGSGVRIKILDALAAGLPVVTTKLGAESIDLVHERSALFAERSDDFAAAILRLLRDRPLRVRLGAAGRAVAERDHDSERVGPRLLALYDEMRRHVRER